MDLGAVEMQKSDLMFLSRVLTRAAPALKAQRAGLHCSSRLLMPVNTVAVPTMGDSVSSCASDGEDFTCPM